MNRDPQSGPVQGRSYIEARGSRCLLVYGEIVIGALQSFTGDDDDLINLPDPQLDLFGGRTG